MEIQTTDELFQEMVARPIHFSREEDFHGFLQILYDKFPERLFRSWRSWKFSDVAAIGINPWNQQICWGVAVIKRLNGEMWHTCFRTRSPWSMFLI